MKKLRILALCMSFCFLFMGCRTISVTEQGNFEKTQWGMSKEEVEKSTKRELNSLEETLSCENPEEVEFVTGCGGKTHGITYYFNEDELYQIVLNTETQTGSNLDYAEDLKDFLSERFETDKEKSKENYYTFKAAESEINLSVFQSAVYITFLRR